MDLQDFESQLMYFDRPMTQEVNELLTQAAHAYSEGSAEPLLQEAFEIDPDNLSVLVAMYRFYYYQHRYHQALDIADHVMSVVAPMISFPGHWRRINFANLAEGVMSSFTMVRFYLLALKGAAYLNLRLGNIDMGVEMLNKVIELDSKDRLGAKGLLQAMGPALVSKRDDVIPITA